MDLIDRQEALDAFDKQYWNLLDIPICKEIRDAAKRTIKALPAVQPHQIVRCKDCKYWMRENISDGYCSEINVGDCDEDFYCGYAVRKDNR